MDKDIEKENELLREMLYGKMMRIWRLEKSLNKIKDVVTECNSGVDCCNCKYTEHCSTDIETQALGVCRMILKLITKAEEE